MSLESLECPLCLGDQFCRRFSIDSDGSLCKRGGPTLTNHFDGSHPFVARAFKDFFQRTFAKTKRFQSLFLFLKRWWNQVVFEYRRVRISRIVSLEKPGLFYVRIDRVYVVEEVEFAEDFVKCVVRLADEVFRVHCG